MSQLNIQKHATIQAMVDFKEAQIAGLINFTIFFWGGRRGIMLEGRLNYKT